MNITVDEQDQESLGLGVRGDRKCSLTKVKDSFSQSEQHQESAVQHRQDLRLKMSVCVCVWLQQSDCCESDLRSVKWLEVLL